ncbi:hypothetical protein [Nocardia sp. NPDC005366]|uniref:hypothetical protein n=1 Tax=Nocardia sp. NPDC005366 TaxID=3156878 RepID=UPI0033A772CE
MPTVLKMLLAERHLKSHPDFLAAYDRCAAQLDPPVPPGYGPAKAQYYQWLSGRMVGLPRDYHRRVLQQMFPGWTVERLFQMVDSPPGNTRSPELSTPVDGELEAFLGAEMITYGATLVYPVQRDNPAVVPENDMRGLLYVAALLQRHTDIRTDFRSDREAATRSDRPHLDFGLRCAQLFLRGVERPLFTVRTTLSTEGPGVECLELSDGTRYDSRGEHHIGIIARARPSPHLHPGGYRFLCAGLGPRGAAGAGWFLANHWSSLHQRAGDHEFVAIIGVWRYSDQTSALEKLLIGPPSVP